MPHRLDQKQALEACRRAVLTDRVRVSATAEGQIESSQITMRHVERAIRTATGAEPLADPEGWRLSGGTDVDGSALTIDVDVRERDVRILRVRGEGQ